MHLADSYDANHVDLTAEKVHGLVEAGGTPNQAMVGAALDTMPNNSLVTAMAGLSNYHAARAALNQLSADTGEIGVPLPGMSFRLSPRRGLYAVVVKGPNVTPGYLDDDERTREAFDEEGFFRTGDLVSFVDPANPDAGLRYEGRSSDEFKLGSGIWVVPGRIKANLLSYTGPLVQDVVVAGPGRLRLVVFLWLNAELVQRDFESLPEEEGRQNEGREALLRFLEGAVGAYNAVYTGSSESVARACVLLVPLSAAFGELTDKGTINQRRFLSHRADLVEAQYVHAAREPGSVGFAAGEAATSLSVAAAC